MANAANLVPSLTFHSFLSNGAPNSFGTLQSYSAGTTTPLATWTDWTALTPNPNPITLNARGEANVYLIPNVAYKFVESDQYGNQIKITDQVVNNQLITLFGGVDTGAANAYILNFTASFTALTNGIVIYWIPSNNNTGPSTLNVNGLGSPQPILNVNGTTLGANQIVANQMTEVVYYNGDWILLTVTNFTGSLIGTFGPSTTIASASTTNLGAASAHVVNITGTTTINSFGSGANVIAPIYVVTFASALTLNYNSGAILPQSFFSAPGSTFQVNAGDSMLLEYLGSGIWQIVSYFTPSTNLDSYLTTAFTTTVTTFAATGLTLTLGVGTYSVRLLIIGYATGATSDGISLQFAGTSVWTGEAPSTGQAPFVVQTGGIGSAMTSGSAGTSTSPTTFATVATFNTGVTLSYIAEGIISVTAGGTLIVNAAQATGPANTSAIGIGSLIIARKL